MTVNYSCFSFSQCLPRSPRRRNKIITFHESEGMARGKEVSQVHISLLTTLKQPHAGEHLAVALHIQLIQTVANSTRHIRTQGMDWDRKNGGKANLNGFAAVICFHMKIRC